MKVPYARLSSRSESLELALITPDHPPMAGRVRLTVQRKDVLGFWKDSEVEIDYASLRDLMKAYEGVVLNPPADPAPQP